jgi:prepilin-type N-terminal cleavage/methylation domain-containing protein
MRNALKHRRAFTLVELVVVIGVIALLAGLLLPMVFRSFRQGKRVRLAADLQAIEAGLNAYKTDFGDFPRFPMGFDPTNPDTAPDRGARLLCRALLGPGPAVGAPTSGFDGADGPGFRLRAGGLGKVWGPYIAIDKFKATSSDETARLRDTDGNVILYYPAKPGNVDISPPAQKMGFVADAPPNAPVIAPQIAPLYNAADNSGFLAVASMRAILGDANADGVIDTAAGEKAMTQAPYLLWDVGVDGKFGLTPKGYTDDVTNFDIPVGLFKN